VLGFGLIYSKNPKTEEVDYIDAVEDTIISASSFYDRQVRVGSRGDKIMAFLPLYLTYSHFVKGLPLLSLLRLYIFKYTKKLRKLTQYIYFNIFTKKKKGK